ncbi:MAG: 23S rRNA (adenine(2503)-C(2))-methyltransferase RlmN [Candidatus Omnitrophica bacterium]|nr:23S rRNA (adenine(2503)-C(2))-methyltransferase RlmN [Candidatus Omnitrophota bacterium]
MEAIYNFSEKDLKDKFTSNDFPAYIARQVFEWVYGKRVQDFDLMSNLSKEVKGFLNENFSISKLSLVKKEKSSDKTEKFLFKLEDDSAIEAVLIPEDARSTLCVSTQVGCKFKCLFCASGENGFKRNLTAGEIIGQYLVVSGLEASPKITNIVFMGIGEPLDNFENTIKSINILMNSAGINFSKRRISISTCGLVPEIKKLAKLKLGIKLSVSLHSADNDIRSKLMPINKKYPLEELIPALREFSKASRGLVTFECVLIPGINTSREDAKSLAKLLNRFNGKANLIPYNGVSSEFKAPTQEEIDIFSQELKTRGVFFTLRKSRGQDINAACGQLRAKYLLEK